MLRNIPVQANFSFFESATQKVNNYINHTLLLQNQFPAMDKTDVP